ncbi:MAG: 1-acyl-sn-glycerol-3-phosphate acyltransferase [Runella sp.]
MKIIVRIALRIFYRRFEMEGREILQNSKGPLIVAVNHPNTFMDPLIVASILPQRVAFIANGSIFNRYTRPIFEYLHVIPVYRQKDTPAAPLPPAELNRQIFQRCFDYLERKGTILIFPEGTSEIERRLREIKTGTARIALGAEYVNNFKLGLKILPIGLNYSDPTLFRSEIFVKVGEPITLADFADEYRPETFETVEKLTDLLQERLSQTVVITQDDTQDTLIRQIEVLYKNQLFEDFNLSPTRKKDEFLILKELVNAAQYTEKHHPALYRKLQVRMTNYLDHLRQLHLSDEVFTQSRRLYQYFGGTLAGLISGFPFYTLGLITNYLPYILPAKIARQITADITYRAPLMMTMGIVLFPVFYGLQLWAIHHFFATAWLTILWAILMPLSGFFVLWYWDKAQRFSRFWQAFRLFRRKPALMASLSIERQQISDALQTTKELYLNKP